MHSCSPSSTARAVRNSTLRRRDQVSLSRQATFACARCSLARYVARTHRLSLSGKLTETEGEQAWLNMLPRKHRALPEWPSAPPLITAAAMAAREPPGWTGKMASTLLAWTACSAHDTI